MTHSKRYDQKAVTEILRRAAELEQGGERSSGTGLTGTDIEQIASEAGLDPAAVRAAIAERDRAHQPAAGLLGGPLQVRFERRIPVELDDEALEEVLELAQLELGMLGSWSRSGRTHTWSPKGVARNLRVSLQVRDGQTELVVAERFGPLAGGLWGGLFGGLVGGSIGLALPLGLAALHSLGAAVAIFGACTAASFFLARGLYGLTSRRRSRDLGALTDKLAEEGLAQADAMALGELAEPANPAMDLPAESRREARPAERRRRRSRSRD